MVTPAAGAVVLVPFPFSDLSQAKLRPAVVLADAGRGDWILCQVTSNPYGDARSVSLLAASFAVGSLNITSYARPGKLFTANRDLMVAEVGRLHRGPLQQILQVTVDILLSSIKRQS
ncbi:MAG: type II toxin-antitoxin system PemK/MazF family toxin [Chloroflexi bacterium]|nr:type II toxin-antitoxin system PemK/MazF family toxin [Chloroflexota bacterium]